MLLHYYLHADDAMLTIWLYCFIANANWVCLKSNTISNFEFTVIKIWFTFAICHHISFLCHLSFLFDWLFYFTCICYRKKMSSNCNIFIWSTEIPICLYVKHLMTELPYYHLYNPTIQRSWFYKLSFKRYARCQFE